MVINGVDPAAKTPMRIRRNWNRAIKGSITATIKTFLPITKDGQGRIALDIATAGGIDASASSLQLKFDTNPGLVVSGSGLKLKLDTNPGLVLGSGGVKVLVDGAGAITLGASGIATAVDGTTIEISSNQLRIKNAAVAGAKFGWATTKGDLLVFDGTAYVRLPVGVDGQVLTADSASAAGVKWA